MADESLFLAASIQPIPTQPAVEQNLPAPLGDVSARSPEQIRATDAVFAKEEENAAAGVFGTWSAGMLLNEIIQDARARAKEEDSERKAEEP